LKKPTAIRNSKIILRLRMSLIRTGLQDSSLPGEKARGFFIAAIRETFEEAGILLGGKTTGNFVSFHDEKVLKRFNDYRHQLE